MNKKKLLTIALSILLAVMIVISAVLYSNLNSTKTQLSEMTTAKEAVDAELATTLEEKTAVETELSEMTSAKEAVDAELATTLEAKTAVETQLSEMTSAKEAVDAELATTLEAKTAVETELSEMTTAKEAVDAELATTLEAKTAVETELSEMTSAKEAVDAELATTLEAKTAVETELSAMTSAKEAVDAELAQCKEDLKRATAAPSKEAVADPVLSGDGWQITSVYEYESYSSYHYDFVLLNTGDDAQFTINVIYYDANDTIIGTDSMVEYACESGYETYWMFDNDAKFEKVAVTVTREPISFMKPCQSSLKTEVSLVNDKAILTITNTGSELIEFVEYRVVFLDENGKFLSYDWGFASPSSLASNATAVCEASFYNSKNAKVASANAYVNGSIYK